MTDSMPRVNIRTALSGFATGYLSACVVISLGIGVVRSFWRFLSGILPDQYLLHGIAWNGILALALGIVFLPFVLLFFFPFRNTRQDKQTQLGVLFAAFTLCIPFWFLDSRILVRKPIAEWIKPLSVGAFYWLPALFLLIILWWLFLARLSTKKIRRRLLGSFVLLLILTAGLGVYSYLKRRPAEQFTLKSSAHRRISVFLVLVDTLRADHLSVYGYGKPTSTNIDALASDGTTYTRAFAHAPWTRPSCGSLLTSKYPPEIGLRRLMNRLPANVPILPQFMRAEGYATAGIVSSVHLSAQFGFDKGWDVLDIGTTYLRWTGVQRQLARLRLIPRNEYYPRYNAEKLTNRAIRWMDAQKNSNRPLFMYLHYSDPHGPYQPPRDQDRWRDFSDGSTRTLTKPPYWPPKKGESFSPVMKNALVARYDAEISFFDHHFGRFIDYLKKQKLYDEALLIITADHGEEFEDHGGWGHGHTLYNELLRVPLIIKFPKSLTGEKETFRSDTVGLVDVVPTIGDVIGATWPESEFRGRSLRLPQESRYFRFVYADNEKPNLRTAYKDEDKLIQLLDEKGTVIGERYHSIASDFNESGDGKIPFDQTHQRLNSLRSLMVAIYNGALSSEKIDIDQETLEELKALGYVN